MSDFDFTFLSTLTLIWYIIEWLLRILAVFVVPRRRKPTAGMAWLMFIFLLPVPGWILFLVIGTSKLPRFRREAQGMLDDYIAWQSSQSKKTDPHVFGTVPKKYAEIAQLAENLTHLPVFTGAKAQALTHYDTCIDAIVDDINAARQSVYIMYYALVLDDTTEPLFEALEHAVRRDVDVRVLYDAFGSWRYPRHKEMKQRLTTIGVRHRTMLPFAWPGRNYIRPDLRNHRKLVVVDGAIGYTGSQNMVQRDYHRRDEIVYDELVVRLEGPIVIQLEAVFMTDWHTETGESPTLRHVDFKNSQLDKRALAQVLPSGPGYNDENNLRAFIAMMYAAEHSITIVTPYFVPDEALSVAITSAAQREVNVTLVNSQVSDKWMVSHAQRSYYDEILDAGVSIYMYNKPTLLHSKFIVIDEEIVAVGTSNMDIRSFELDQELTLISYDERFARELADTAEAYIKKSKHLTKQIWSKRSWSKKLLDNIARLTSSLQ